MDCERLALTCQESTRVSFVFFFFFLAFFSFSVVFQRLCQKKTARSNLEEEGLQRRRKPEAGAESCEIPGNAEIFFSRRWHSARSWVSCRHRASLARFAYGARPRLTPPVAARRRQVPRSIPLMDRRCSRRQRKAAVPWPIHRTRDSVHTLYETVFLKTKRQRDPNKIVSGKGVS